MFLLVFHKYFVYGKGTWFQFEAILTEKPENHYDGVPVRQAILANTTVFTSYS